MDLKDALELPAGRELDAEVALRLGQTVECIEDSFYNTDTMPPTIEHIQVPEVNGFRLPGYSTDIKDAWPLLGEMLADWKELTFYLDSGGTVWFGAGFDGQPIPSIKDAPLAICRTWLRWKKAA